MKGGRNSAGYPDPTATIAISRAYRDQKRKERNMKQHKYIINRKTYKTVKQYDHEQFDAFCAKIYTKGWEDGQRAGKIITDDIIDALRSVKGIGPSTLNNIKAALEEKLGGRKEA